MEFEAWWLLAIPLFFGLGWFTARMDQRGGRSAAAGLPDAYFKGLNFLLNEQPDKAIDAFVDVVRIEPDTVELHFALGNLFRRRGETDRAIRVHQNLAERSDLDQRQREHALHELGQDFLKAGLLDRAEDVFTRLEGGHYASSALHHRLEIAQIVRDWPLAISLAERLQRDAGEDHKRIIAQFHAELATQALAGSGADRLGAAARQIELAIAADGTHPRPWLLRGEVALAEGDAEGAVRAWTQMIHHNPAYLSLVATGWLKAHEALGRLDGAITILQKVYEDHPSVDSLDALITALSQRSGPAQAISWAEQALRKTPSLLGLQKLLALRAEQAQGEAQANIALTQQLIQAQANRLSRYVCAHCGFKARQFYWQCPGCNRWDSYPPRRSEELERA